MATTKEHKNNTENTETSVHTLSLLQFSLVLCTLPGVYSACIMGFSLLQTTNYALYEVPVALPFHLCTTLQLAIAGNES